MVFENHFEAASCFIHIGIVGILVTVTDVVI